MAAQPPASTAVGQDVAVVLGSFLVLGVLSGVLWWWVVTPAEFTKLPNGGSMSEVELGKQFDAIVDLEDQFRHVVVPIERHHGFRRQPPPAARIERRRHGGRQVVDVVEQRLEHPCSRNDALGDALGKARDGRFLPVDEKKPAPDRTAGADPAHKL